jgi:hypothetical protein
MLYVITRSGAAGSAGCGGEVHAVASKAIAGARIHLKAVMLAALV